MAKALSEDRLLLHATTAVAAAIVLWEGRERKAKAATAIAQRKSAT